MSRACFERKLFGLGCDSRREFWSSERSGKMRWAAAFGVLLSLLGAPANVWAVTKTISPMEFGRVVVGYNSGSDGVGTYFCATPGTGSFTVESMTIAGAEPADFSIQNINVCNGQYLNSSYPCDSPENGCSFTPVFQPTTYGNRTATLVVTTDAGDIDWTMKGTGGIILVNGQPTDGDEFPIAASGPMGVDEATDPIAFSAAGVGSGQTVNWKTTLEYKTSGGVPPTPNGFTVAPTFKTTGTASSSQTFTSEGGLLKVFATVGTFTDQIPDDEVVGVTPPTGIPYDAITNQLESLYQGVNYILYLGKKVSFTPATSELMAQVATVESSERQFADEGLYYSDSSWPLESSEVKNRFGRTTSRAGAHIGLMQLPVTMADAWDWLQNAHDGVLLPNPYSFQEKLTLAYDLFANPAILKAHPGLSALTSCQLEEMALELNGPYPGRGSKNQYYVTQKANGSWSWLINNKNPCGICYVISVRNTAPLSGGTASSCPATPTIPADPPIDYYYDCSACNK